MKLGIGTYAYAWAIGAPSYPLPERPMSVFYFIDKAAALNVDVIQICDNMPLHLLNDGEIERIGEAASKNGIMVEVGTRGIKPELLAKYLEIAKRLDSRIVRTLLHSADFAPGIEEAINCISTVLERYEDAGITLAIENHDKFKTYEYINVIKALKSNYIGICLDTVNSFGALECPEFVINEFAPYTVNLHIKEFDIVRISHQMGYSIIGKPAGEGKLNIDLLFQKFQSKNFSAILELWTPFENTVENTVLTEDEWVKKSISFLKPKF